MGRPKGATKMNDKQVDGEVTMELSISELMFILPILEGEYDRWREFDATHSNTVTRAGVTKLFEIMSRMNNEIYQNLNRKEQ
jgi:hypothetical protein